MIKLVHHEMVINSKFLEVPRSYYQRHLNASRVKRIAAEFDERIANAPKVSYRDGHYYVFDGQHTIAARKLLNNNSDGSRMIYGDWTMITCSASCKATGSWKCRK